MAMPCKTGKKHQQQHALKQRQQVCPQCWYSCTKLHGVTGPKTLTSTDSLVLHTHTHTQYILPTFSVYMARIRTNNSVSDSNWKFLTVLYIRILPSMACVSNLSSLFLFCLRAYVAICPCWQKFVLSCWRNTYKFHQNPSFVFTADHYFLWPQ